MRYRVSKSNIHGLGMIAEEVIPKDTPLGELMGTERREGCRMLYQPHMTTKWYEYQEFRYCNHSSTPNTYYKVKVGQVSIFTNSHILKGEEITVDYSWCEYLSGFIIKPPE